MEISKEHINDLVQKTIDATTKELKRQGMIKTKSNDGFRKTEMLLFNYPRFKEAIEDKREQIREIEGFGLRRSSKSIVKMSVTSTKNLSGEYEKDLEQKEIQIAKFREAIEKTESYIDKIDKAVSKLEGEPYHDIIRMRYFEGMTRGEIAEELFIDESTVSRNKNKLINILQIHFFPNDYLSDLMGYEL